MKTSMDIRKYVAEQGVSEGDAQKKGLKAESKQFVGVEAYAEDCVR